MGWPDGFRLNEDQVVVNTADITPSGTRPPDFEDDERVVLIITDDSNNLVGYASREGLSFGRPNTFFFSENLQLREDLSYTATLRRRLDDPVPRNLDVSKIEISGRDTSNFIRFKYARLPRKMTSLEDYCEMPSWSMEAVYAYGHIIAFKKMTRRQIADPALVNEFKDQTAEIKNYRYRRDERGPHSMLDSGSSVAEASPFPGNFAVGYVDPFDLI